MITLFGFGPAFGLPDPSPFVMKTDVQLKMAALVSVSSTPARTERGQSSVPEAIHEQAQAQARKSVRAALEGHQLSRHSEAKTVKLGARSLAALSGLIGERPYLLGEAFSGPDAIAFVGYKDRMTQRYFSAFSAQQESCRGLAGA